MSLIPEKAGKLPDARMKGMSDQANSNRPRESAVMAGLERIIAEAEAAEALVQDDGWVTNELERRTILNRLSNIRAAVHEVELALGPKVME